MEHLNEVFETFFYKFCEIAKWVYAFRMASDAIKRGNDSDIQGALKAIGSGCLGYGCLYSIVYFLNMVQGAVEGSFK
jgi:hypothetical protein